MFLYHYFTSGQQLISADHTVADVSSTLPTQEAPNDAVSSKKTLQTDHVIWTVACTLLERGGKRRNGWRL